MFRRSIIAIALFSPALLALNGCSSRPDFIVDQTLVTQVVQTTQDSLFDAANPLLNKNTFEQISLALATVKEAQRADHLLYYLRAFSYFGPVDELDETSIASLTFGLNQLAKSELLHHSSRLQEQYAVTLYRYYADNERTMQLATLLPQLDAQLYSLGQSDSNQGSDYALWETLRAYGLLLNKARKNADGELNKLLVKQDLARPLLDFAASPQSIRSGSDWPKANAYWALGLYRLTLPASESDEPTQAERKIDDAVAKIARKDIELRGDIAKDTYTLGYHVNAFAGKEACLNNSDICRIPEIEDILPVKHSCSDGLFILAQDLNEQELVKSCSKLTSQESNFHQVLETGYQPTANDFNDALRVVAFKNWSQYNAYGQLLFDIDTDNGGMYIEGTPSKPGNQATFFAYRQFWIEPEFAIWNLNHEYVHYLDGHFVKYGGFGHFPEKMVWWSEGLAEYISKGNDNPNTLKVIKSDIDKAPSLEEIFATEYKDGQDRTYKWSYMAVRFLVENHHTDFIQLSHYLKTDYFEGYNKLMAELTSYQAEFSEWLTIQVKQFDDSEERAKPRLHKQNRYGYRDYLQPGHLVKDDAHRHY
ncbi:collagenase [Shewanella atlantica]|uniref:collagenase n=1 Tax=Shewanella atlantica TaxID=271099 RepID=UPI0037354771